MRLYRSAEELLLELAIEHPAEIALDVIAFHCGVLLQCAPLEGCAAHIIGAGDRAAITVDEASSGGRRRFSIAHELGHWNWHRGRSLTCQAADIAQPWSMLNPEAVANGFAADLTMPSFMFGPLADGQPITFAAVDRLAADFRVSRPAAAIRLVELGGDDAMIIHHGPEGRRWFKASRRVEGTLWPHRQLGPDSDAADILRGGEGNGRSVLVDADDWIDHPAAARYQVREHSMRYGDGVLTLLWWKDPSMVEDLTG